MEPLLLLDGSRFDDLERVVAVLEPLANDERIEYRNANAEAIATADAAFLLVVAGPGAGKSHLFLARIRHWLDRDPVGAIYVATFVRKLVRDLEVDLDRLLTNDQRRRVSASTLHTLARSIISRSGGSPSCALGVFVRMVDAYWSPVIWADVRAFHPAATGPGYGRKQFEAQLHADEYEPGDEWVGVRETYWRLCTFYNAVGFADLIVLAREAVEDDPTLISHSYWIFDEYQDFNMAEDHLIAVVTANADGVLLAGDDEQALYLTLKASTPDIIIRYYDAAEFANAMLPFCSRCSYYICGAASAFMASHREDGSIEKAYLPLVVDEGAERVHCVAVAAPESEVDYVRKFLEDQAAEFADYMSRRDAGEDTDPFLLLLSQSGGLTLSKKLQQEVELHALVEQYAGQSSSRSGNYRRVLTYAAAGANERDNFAIRKLFHHEGVGADEIHVLLVDALESGRSLGEAASADHGHLVERARRVVEVLDSAGDRQEEAADRLNELLELGDDGSLGNELAEYPIAVASSREMEDDAAIASAPLIDPVALMPITGSKGLSAHHVIVLGCDDVNTNPVTPLMFFVAMTRARRSLHLVVSAKAAGAKAPHPFVLDLSEDYCDYATYKKTGRVTEPLANRVAFESQFSTWERAKARLARR